MPTARFRTALLVLVSLCLAVHVSCTVEGAGDLMNAFNSFYGRLISTPRFSEILSAYIYKFSDIETGYTAVSDCRLNAIPFPEVGTVSGVRPLSQLFRVIRAKELNVIVGSHETEMIYSDAGDGVTGFAVDVVTEFASSMSAYYHVTGGVKVRYTVVQADSDADVAAHLHAHPKTVDMAIGAALVDLAGVVPMSVEWGCAALLSDIGVAYSPRYLTTTGSGTYPIGLTDLTALNDARLKVCTTADLKPVADGLLGAATVDATRTRADIFTDFLTTCDLALVPHVLTLHHVNHGALTASQIGPIVQDFGQRIAFMFHPETPSTDTNNGLLLQLWNAAGRDFDYDASVAANFGAGTKLERPAPVNYDSALSTVINRVPLPTGVTRAILLSGQLRIDWNATVEVPSGLHRTEEVTVGGVPGTRHTGLEVDLAENFAASLHKMYGRRVDVVWGGGGATIDDKVARLKAREADLIVSGVVVRPTVTLDADPGVVYLDAQIGVAGHTATWPGPIGDNNYTTLNSPAHTVCDVPGTRCAAWSRATWPNATHVNHTTVDALWEALGDGSCGFWGCDRYLLETLHAADPTSITVSPHSIGPPSFIAPFFLNDMMGYPNGTVAAPPTVLTYDPATLAVTSFVVSGISVMMACCVVTGVAGTWSVAAVRYYSIRTRAKARFT